LRDCQLLLERCVVVAVSSSPPPSSSLSHYSLLLLSSPYLGVPLSLSLSRAIYRWSQTALSLLFCGLKSLAGFLSIMDFGSSLPRETADRYHHSSEAIGKMEKRTPGSHDNSRCRSINTRKAKQAKKLWEKEVRSSKEKPTKNTYCNKLRANNDTQKRGNAEEDGFPVEQSPLSGRDREISRSMTRITDAIATTNNQRFDSSSSSSLPWKTEVGTHSHQDAFGSLVLL
jgi:hypothetical protein